jgi:hypothetical protein
MNPAPEQRFEPAPVSLPNPPSAWGQWLVAFVPPLAITVCAVTLFSDAIYRSIASSSHPILVYVILGAYFLGLLMCAVALLQYQRETRYVCRWQGRIIRGRIPGPGSAEGAKGQPIVAAALASLLGPSTPSQAQARFELEVAAASSALADRLAYANYMVGSLIGLGLVGTFVGLLGTLEDLGAVFGSLAGTGDANINPTAVFANMVQKLQDPMKGMGTAFVSSLYGLLGSLVVGLCALSVSKAGSAVVKQLHSAARTLEAVFPPSSESESGRAGSGSIEALQNLMVQVLESQVQRDTRMQKWLEANETRLTHFIGQTIEASHTANSQLLANHHRVAEQLATLLNAQSEALEANRLANSEALAQQRQAAEQLSALLSAHGQNTQSLSIRMVEQDQRLSETVADLVDRVNNDQAFLRDDVIGSLERTHAERIQQMSGISQAVTQLSGLTERSASMLKQHIENQEALVRRSAPKTKPKRSWWWPFGSSDPWDDDDLAHERQDVVLGQLAKSIDRQSQVLEGLFHRQRGASLSRTDHDRH